MDPVQKVNDSTSLALRIQNATGFALPSIIPFKETIIVKDSQDIEANAELQQRLASGLKAIAAANYVMPVTLALPDGAGDPFVLPVDPMVSFSGHNNIIRRYVAKNSMRGSIKSRFSVDDYQITIAGVLIADDGDSLNKLIQTFRELLENGKNGLSITNDMMNSCLNILRIAVEDYDFPFTKGIGNQAFTIKAYSDDAYTLLIDLRKQNTTNV